LQISGKYLKVYVLLILMQIRVYERVYMCMLNGKIYLRWRNAAKGGKKKAGWNAVRTTHAIASILSSCQW
jgi:hypothetical protein